MQWLGHSNSAMVRHYCHLHDDEAQRQMKRLNVLNCTFRENLTRSYRREQVPDEAA